MSAQDQELRQVVQALQAAQEQVLAQAQELAQVLGLAAAQVEALLEPAVDLWGPGPLTEL